MASTFPARLGTPEQCRTLREFLTGARFTEAALLASFGIPELNALLTADAEERARLRQRIESGGAQMLLAKLFLGGFRVTWQEASRYIPGSIFEILKALGLYDESGRCPVLFYPAYGFWIASDRPLSSDGSGYGGPDFVMSALEYLSRTYVESIGRTPCRRFLEVGAGAGLGALCATRFAEEVWATDITQRSIECMEFNRGLNGVSEEKLRLARGDMYSPVAGLTFDRIACNPPFEPPLRHDLIYSVGGADGEQLIERTVREGVPLLAPGGRLYCQVLGTDRAGDSFFERMGRWLEGSPCGLAYFVRARLSTDGYTAGQLMNTGADGAVIEQWDRFYGRMRATHVTTGHVIVERGAAFRLMETLGAATGWDDMEQRIEWDEANRRAGWREHVRNGVWSTADGCSLRVYRTLRDGEYVVAERELACRAPFDGSWPAPEIVQDILLSAATPARGRDIVDRVKAGASAQEEEILNSMAMCIARGALREGATA